MGCRVSIHIEFDPIDEVEEKMLNEFLKLGFEKEEIDDLYTTFVGMDADESHQISRDEFLRGMSVEPTPFMRKVFSIMDMDNSGELNFLEFVCSIWNILCNDTRTIGSFIYLIIPKTEIEIQRGRLKTANVIEMIRGIHMKEVQSGGDVTLEALLREIEKQFTGDISVHQLEQFIYENPSLCSPVYVAQESMRAVILGKQAWGRLLKRRRNQPDLDNYQYPFVLRDIIDSIQQRFARKQKAAAKSVELKQSRGGGNKRKNSILLSFFNADKGKHIKQRTADETRSASQGGKNTGNINENALNFAEKQKTYNEVEKKNAAAFKMKNVKRPQSAKTDTKTDDTKRGAPIEKLGEGIRAFAVKVPGSNSSSPIRPKSSKR